MLKRLLLLLSVAALAVPAAASATDVQVSGQAVMLQGRAALHVDLTASAGAKPVRLRARLAVMRFVDLGGDLNVKCGGRGRAKTTKDDQGHTVMVCAGVGRAQVEGSHFRIAGFALRYGIAIPDGYTGTVQGDVRPFERGQSQQGQEGQAGSDPGQTPQQRQAGFASQGNDAASIDAALAATLGK